MHLCVAANVFCRSDVIRKVLQPPRPLDPHSRRSKTNEGSYKDHRASICFHQRRSASAFFPSLSVSLSSRFCASARFSPTPQGSRDLRSFPPLLPLPRHASFRACIGCVVFPGNCSPPFRARNKEDKQKGDVTSPARKGKV